jgi:ribonuclease BN (tRNA processing enzyme)
MKLYVLGVGDTFTEKHNTHALLVEAEGFRLAIDCPDSYRRVLRGAREKAGAAHASSLDLFAIDDVLVTHVHGDHVNGLEGAAYFKFFAQKRKLRLHTIGAVKDALWDGRLVASMGRLMTSPSGTEFRDLSFEDYFDWSEVALDRATTIGPFTIRARTTKHHVPTSALVIEHRGRSIGVSSDTAFDPELIAFLAASDLVVHETNYGPAHTAYADLLTLDDAVKAKMRLIHYPDEFDVEKSAIPCLREGDVLEV